MFPNDYIIYQSSKSYISPIALWKAGVAILSILQKITKPFKVWWRIFNVTEEGWVRRRGKGEGYCGEIFL